MTICRRRRVFAVCYQLDFDIDMTNVEMSVQCLYAVCLARQNIKMVGEGASFLMVNLI